MIPVNNTIAPDDPDNLTRFTNAQQKVYNTVLTELKNGHKRSHWMWYIFPQIDGLGHSAMSKLYALKSIAEAEEYLNHPLLGTRLLECSEAVLTVEGRSISEIFGYPDDLKLKSSMTLFAYLANSSSVFVRVLNKYFQGEKDVKTVDLLEKLKEKNSREKA